MNTDLAEQIIGKILMEPERFDMAEWFGRYDEGEGEVVRVMGRAGRLRADCGTTACIAGWALLLTLADDVPVYGAHVVIDGCPRSTLGEAARALDLAWDVAEILFTRLDNDEAVPALKFLIGNPAATAAELFAFAAGGREADIIGAIGHALQDRAVSARVLP